MAKYKVMSAINKALELQGLKVMVLLRLSPVIPFNAFNYVAGLTLVSLRDYTIALLGMIPGVIAFTLFGALASSVEDATKGGQKNPTVVRGV